MRAGWDLRRPATAGPPSQTLRDGSSATEELRRSESACAGTAPIVSEDAAERSASDEPTKDGTPSIHADEASIVSPPFRKITLVAAVGALFAALYVELSDDIFLVAASTSLALALYWLANQRLGNGSHR